MTDFTTPDILARVSTFRARNGRYPTPADGFDWPAIDEWLRKGGSSLAAFTLNRSDDREAYWAATADKVRSATVPVPITDDEYANIHCYIATFLECNGRLPTSRDNHELAAIDRWLRMNGSDMEAFCAARFKASALFAMRDDVCRRASSAAQAAGPGSISGHFDPAAVHPGKLPAIDGGTWHFAGKVEHLAQFTDPDVHVRCEPGGPSMSMIPSDPSPATQPAAAPAPDWSTVKVYSAIFGRTDDDKYAQTVDYPTTHRTFDVASTRRTQVPDGFVLTIRAKINPEVRPQDRIEWGSFDLSAAERSYPADSDCPQATRDLWAIECLLRS